MNERKKIKEARNFLIGRLLASDGFPVNEKSLKDGFYFINNISQILIDYFNFYTKAKNEWIPITRKTELPKPGTYVFICYNGEISRIIWKISPFGRFESEFKELKKMQVTHYKLVEFPTLKPLYDGI